MAWCEEGGVASEERVVGLESEVTVSEEGEGVMKGEEVGREMSMELEEERV